MPETEMRMVKWKDILYLRKEDVVAYFLACSKNEETDTRARFCEAAANLAALKMRSED
jgi:hypothetical protein